jgi:HSP20 family protein
MKRKERGGASGVEHIQVEMLSILHDSMPGQRWVSPRQPKTWRPPTDVYEIDECVVVKVEIAGMDDSDFSISLDANKLVISGVRHDPAAKLGYQQMEILYGHFETEVHLPRAIDEEGIEATYQNGFLSVHLAKAQPRHVPVVSTEDSS